MTEWNDNHTMPSDFRKLLQERIENASPHRNLTAEETKRLSKL